MVDVLNLSVQIGNDNKPPDDNIRDAVARAKAKGVIVVASAGNAGPSPGTMSQIAVADGVISVGSADWDGTRLSPFSSRGLTGVPWSGPTVVAPGENLIGCWMVGREKAPDRVARDEEHITPETIARQSGRPVGHCDLDKIRTLYTVESGTSQACAYVSGLLAKFVGLRKSLNLPHVGGYAETFLRLAARPIPGCTRAEQGYGFVSNGTIRAYLAMVTLDDPFWRGASVDPLRAWSESRGEGSASVGIVDTGCPAHPSIRVGRAADFTNSESGVWDVHGHSTHITGIIGG